MRTPKITWGTSFANTLGFLGPLDNAVAYGEPREGSECAQATSGAEDAWIVGTDQYLEGDVRWIPGATAGSITGWDGSTGWAAFLAWARAKNAFRFFPDATSGTYQSVYLVEPAKGAPTVEETDGTRRLRLKLRDAAQAAFEGY